MKLLKKSLNNKSIFSFIMVALLSVSSVIASYSPSNEKTISKARTAIQNASQDDWETYAKSAQICIEKNINMKEAFTWINHSIEIKESTMNLTIKGDYYLKNKLPRKAMEQYLKAIELGKEFDFDYDTSDLQAKIDKARKIQKKLI